jgi:hypothetical protein
MTRTATKRAVLLKKLVPQGHGKTKRVLTSKMQEDKFFALLAYDVKCGKRM